LKLVKSRRDADNVLASFIEEKEVRDFLLQNLKFESYTTWDLNLTSLEKNMEKILNFPSSNQVFNGETLLIVGENSTYVSADNISVMRKKFPDLRVKRIGGAGHWVHVEKPIEFERSVREFLSF
jgi:pimeloyl-ACP methyl ester carboxylesterase